MHSLARVAPDTDRPARDEGEHPDVASESWWWWGWSDDLAVGWFVGLEVRRQRFDYRAGLVRRGQPYLYVEELDGTGRRAGLELKPPEMWAGHRCDVPYRQWTLGAEAHGVLLDEPFDALDRPYGTVAPVTFEVEWHSQSATRPIAHGYEQVGAVDAEVELRECILRFRGPGHRLHIWGAPYRPSLRALPAGAEALWAPYRCSDATGPVGVEQVLTRAGWWARTASGK